MRSAKPFIGLLFLVSTFLLQLHALPALAAPGEASVAIQQDVRPDEHVYRIPRPSAVEPQRREEFLKNRNITSAQHQEFSANLSTGLQSDSQLLGHYIYENMRTPMSRSNFIRWQKNYSDPIVCNMVLCNGSCGDFEEHCPSFSDSARSLHLRSIGCDASTADLAGSSSQNCCGDNK